VDIIDTHHLCLLLPILKFFHLPPAFRLVWVAWLIGKPRTSFLNSPRQLYLDLLDQSCYNYLLTIITQHRSTKRHPVNPMGSTYITLCFQGARAILAGYSYKNQFTSSVAIPFFLKVSRW
jgi:hypothetical protein